nr:immunoglobulin light chain junction region [Macaca mulatta]MOY17586.1 immunoglobulin light chain junction region [Macaca mulatta]MOY17817.1 immunoglobulin light chain junction region [Macaca mulatta]
DYYCCSYTASSAVLF